MWGNLQYQQSSFFNNTFKENTKRKEKSVGYKTLGDIKELQCIALFEHGFYKGNSKSKIYEMIEQI